MCLYTLILYVSCSHVRVHIVCSENSGNYSGHLPINLSIRPSFDARRSNERHVGIPTLNYDELGAGKRINTSVYRVDTHITAASHTPLTSTIILLSYGLTRQLGER